MQTSQGRAARSVLWLAVLSSSCLLHEADLDREEEPSPPFSLVATFKGSQLWPCDSVFNSSRTILDASEEFKSMSGTIQLGRKLITKYNRRELTDKLLIFLALALFLATVLYIVKKRLFPFL